MTRTKRNAILGLLAPLLLATAGQAGAQTEYRYDAQGRAAGRAETRGDTTRCYDAQGRNTGREEAR